MWKLCVQSFKLALKNILSGFTLVSALPSEVHDISWYRSWEAQSHGADVNATSKLAEIPHGTERPMKKSLPWVGVAHGIAREKGFPREMIPWQIISHGKRLYPCVESPSYFQKLLVTFDIFV